MAFSKHLAFLTALLVLFSACGADDEAAVSDEEPVIAEPTVDPVPDDDHDDEGHADDDHEDDDHEDDDHEDDDHDVAGSGLGAHEHGVAELTVAWTGGDLVIDLISPTYNIFGFEYEATTEDDLAIVSDQIDSLSAPGIIAINPEAGCVPVDDVATELEYEGSHAELTASWLLSCDNPAEIRNLEVAALFAEFPDLQDIDVQWASETAQSSAELSPSNTVLSLE